jgi:hypothetical protein
MKRVICLLFATAFAGTLVGCENSYYERRQYPNGYVPADYGYAPGRNYNTRSDYYRHYNGIDG